MPGMEGIIAAVVIAVLLFSLLLVLLTRYKKCPSDKIMVIYGQVGRDKDGSSKSSICIHGGAAFVWPLVQAYQFLDLTPMSLQVDLVNALSRQNIRVDVPSRFTVGISTEQGVMQNAAERLLGLSLASIQELAKDIIFGQLRLVVATMDIEEINTDRDKFLEAVSRNVETELKKIGLRLINVNVTDISDESGYITALGREAAAKAINDAKKSVAEKERDGAIGEANANMDQRIKVAQANATAIQGENDARIDVTRSNAKLREQEAEAQRIATAAEKVQSAKALEESYSAERAAEEARAAREKATLEADIIVKTEVEKRRIELEAEAQAEQIRRKARGEADAIYMRMEAEARGAQEMLIKQADGFTQVVAGGGQSFRCAPADACGQDGSSDADSGGRHQEHQDRQGDRLGRRERRKERHSELPFRDRQEHPAHAGAVRHGGHAAAELPRHTQGGRSARGRRGHGGISACLSG